MSDVTFKLMTVPVSASASNSFALGDPQSVKVPSAILFPASLRGTTRIKFQVSHDDTTYYDLYQGTSLIYIVSTVSVLVAVPDIIQQLTYGWEYVRIVTMNSSNAATNTSVGSMIMAMFIISADIDNPSVPDPNAVLGTVTSTSAGDVASGATDSGNPVKMGAVFNTAPPTVTTGQRVNVQATNRGELIAALGSGGVLAALGPAGDGVSNAAAVGFYGQAIMTAFNGTTLDRWRNNVAATLLASAGRTSIQTSADIPTYNFKALTVILDVTSAGTGSITVTINGKDPASGKYYLLLSGAAVVTAVTNPYHVGPGIAASANVSVSSFLPAIIQIVVTHNNANSITYSVGYNLMI